MVPGKLCQRRNRKYLCSTEPLKTVILKGFGISTVLHSSVIEDPKELLLM